MGKKEDEVIKKNMNFNKLLVYRGSLFASRDLLSAKTSHNLKNILNNPY